MTGTIDMTTKAHIRQEAEALERRWDTQARWDGIERTYTPEDVVRLRGSVRVEHTLARLGAERLWQLLQHEPYVRALGRADRRPGRADGRRPG